MNNTALVTGASSGIGLELARLFAGDGHDLVLVARSEGRLREIDVLVNNAGFGLSGAFIDNGPRTQLDMLQVNVVALTELTRLLLPPMVARRSGRILNVASTAAFAPGPLAAVYGATKAYVLSFSEAIGEELRHSGVTVTALCPGPTQSGFSAAAGAGSTRLYGKQKPMSSADVARAGHEGLRSGRRVVITGLRNKLLVQSAH